MAGEVLDRVEVGKLGLAGDRAFGVTIPDRFEMVGAAVSPRDYGDLLRWRARYLAEPSLEGALPELELIAPDGSVLAGKADECEEAFTEALTTSFGRSLVLWSGDARGALSMAARAGQDGGDAVPKLPYPAAPLHLITTASLCEARRLQPEGDFAVERFRPNIVVDTGEEGGFLEADWVGKSLRIGEAVTLGVFQECERCVETTLPQGSLAKDPAILRTIVEHNNQNLGIYLGVADTGEIRVGDTVYLVED